MTKYDMRHRWTSMIARCTNQKSRDYPRYGGRGIRVCAEWLGEDGYCAFLQHLGERPSVKHSIDRIDNDGNYEPSNVRWATQAEQNRNKRDNNFIEFRGQRKTLTDWARQIGIAPSALRSRFKKQGWSFEKSMTHPPMMRTDNLKTEFARKRALQSLADIHIANATKRSDTASTKE